MIDYITSEEFKLPSLGLVYDKEVNPVIKLRAMTTNDEMKRLNRSDRQYKIMSDILDDCMVTKPGISSYDMCLADYQYLLHRLRVITYGPEYQMQCRCQYCLSDGVETVNLDEFPVVYFNESIKEDLEFELPQTKAHIKLKLQTPHMMDDIELMIKKVKKQSHSAVQDNSQDASRLFYTIKYMIAEVNGEKPDSYLIEDFIKQLPMRDTNYLMKKAGKLVDSFGLKTDLSITCEVCGLTYEAPFRITSEFYGPSID